jgi:hypothetical protein
MAVTQMYEAQTRVLVTYNAAKVDDDIRARVEYVQGSTVVFTEYSASCAFYPVERDLDVETFLFHFRPVRSGV